MSTVEKKEKLKKYPKYIKATATPSKIKENVDIEKRESLELCFTERSGFEGKVTCILMNPSKATGDGSDKTIDKLIDFVEEKLPTINQLVIVNLFSVYKTNSKELYKLLEEVKEKLNKDEFDELIDSNIDQIKDHISSSEYVICGWGDAPDGFPKEEYRKAINKIHDILYETKSQVYVFETSWLSILTNDSQPRHPIRNKLNSLKACIINQTKKKKYIKVT